MVPYFSPGFLHIWPHCPLPSPVPSHPPITHKSGRWSRAHEYLQQMSSYINTQGCILIGVPLFGFQANYCFLILPPEILFKPILARWNCLQCSWTILRLWLTLTFLGACSAWNCFPTLLNLILLQLIGLPMPWPICCNQFPLKNWKMRKYCWEIRNHGHLSFMAGKPIYFWHSNFCLAWNIHTFIGKCQQMWNCWTKLVEIKVWSWLKFCYLQPEGGENHLTN